MIRCYIIFSKALNKFYTGVTQEGVESRINKHNEHFYGNTHFTSQTNDWELFVFIECTTFPQAVNIERQIKRMKSATYIKNLQKYPKLIDKLRMNYSESGKL